MAAKKNQKPNKKKWAATRLKKSAGRALAPKAKLCEVLPALERAQANSTTMKKPASKASSAAKKNMKQKPKKSMPKASFAVKKSAPVGKRPDAPKKTSYSKLLRTNILASADVRQQLIEMGGENTIDIIREFDSDMTDEELARKTGMKASDVRVVLNRLHNMGLFFYTRMRDKDSGWYSYIWKMNEGKLKEFSDSIECEGQGETARVADKEGYVCESCEPRKVLDFETAMDTQFKCGSCGSALAFSEGKRK